MKIKNSSSSIDKLFIHSKIFQSLKVPDRNKRLIELQKNVINLRNSLSLLNSSKTKRQINRKKKRKSIIIPNSMLSNLYSQKRNKKFTSLENFIPENNSDNESISINSPIKDKNYLYMNKASELKRRNLLLLQKLSNKNVKGKNSFKDLYNINKNFVFMTESGLPSINKNNKNHYKMKKAFTEGNNYYENTINNIKNNKKSKNNLKDEMRRISDTEKNMLPPIEIKKERILNLQNFPDKKRKDTIKNISNNSNTSSNISSEEENESENILDSEKKKVKSKENLTIETEKINYLRKKNIFKMNKKLNSIFEKNSSGKKNNSEIKNLLSTVNKIGANFKNKQFTYELEKWIMRARFKYANWKYGIADINKYFIDMKEFGEQEEKELEMRKSFYEKVELVIKELKDDREKREILNIENKYGININNEKKNIIKNNEYWNNDKAKDKMEEMCKALKLTKQRIMKEKQRRNLIEEIMFQCKKGINNIKNS